MKYDADKINSDLVDRLLKNTTNINQKNQHNIFEKRSKSLFHKAFNFTNGQLNNDIINNVSQNESKENTFSDNLKKVDLREIFKNNLGFSKLNTFCNSSSNILGRKYLKKGNYLYKMELALENKYV